MANQNFKIGQIFTINDFEGENIYILSCVDYLRSPKVAFINVKTGHRATNPVFVKDTEKITQEEIESMDFTTLPEIKKGIEVVLTLDQEVQTAKKDLLIKYIEFCIQLNTVPRTDILEAIKGVETYEGIEAIENILQIQSKQFEDLTK